MPEYRRVREDGGIYFFTVVTYQRLPILTNEPCREILHQVWQDTQKRFPFATIAVCLLPDHIHTIWKLPEGDANYSLRWREIKRLFTKAYLHEVGPGEARNASRQKRGEAAVWQRRFWEHTISDEIDLENHIDYLHYNPIKHGYVKKASEWQWSSFQRFVDKGVYDIDWIGGEEGRLSKFDWD
jgi:putative transposase